MFRNLPKQVEISRNNKLLKRLLSNLRKSTSLRTKIRTARQGRRKGQGKIMINRKKKGRDDEKNEAD